MTLSIRRTLYTKEAFLRRCAVVSISTLVVLDDERYKGAEASAQIFPLAIGWQTSSVLGKTKAIARSKTIAYT